MLVRAHPQQPLLSVSSPPPLSALNLVNLPLLLRSLKTSTSRRAQAVRFLFQGAGICWVRDGSSDNVNFSVVGRESCVTLDRNLV